MCEILILARVRIHQFDIPVIADYYFDVSKRLAGVEGFLGLSVWRDPSDQESFLVTYDYADLAAAERGLIAVTEVRSLAESQSADFRPADVQRVRIAERSPKKLHEAPATSCLSMSVRVADPGYGPELLDEVGRVFEELQLLPGFVSSMYGTNDTLEEEVIGLVTWTSRSAFLGSIPPGKKPRQVVAYDRFY